MYFAYFLARRFRQLPKGSFPRIVHRIGVFSMALGLATALIACLVMEGFQRNITQKLVGLGGDFQIVKYSSNKTYEDPPWSREKLLNSCGELSDSMLSMRAFAHKTILVRSSDAVEGVVFKGLDAGAGYGQLSGCLMEGRMIDFASERCCHEILLSKHMATRLRVGVGDELLGCVFQDQVRYRKLRVVGIYATHISELDSRLGFCDLRLVQRLNGWPADWVGGYEVFLRDGLAMWPVIERIRGCIDYDLGVKTTREAHPTLFDWIQIMSRNATIFTVLMFLMMCTNLVSIVLIQMIERTPTVGVLKVLGMSDSQIGYAMFWGNGPMVAKGLLGGNVLAVGVYALQRYMRVITLDPAYYHIDHVPMIWDWSIFWGINVIALLIVLVTLFVSFVIIAWLRPIKILKSEFLWVVFFYTSFVLG